MIAPPGGGDGRHGITIAGVVSPTCVEDVPALIVGSRFSWCRFGGADELCERFSFSPFAVAKYIVVVVMFECCWATELMHVVVSGTSSVFLLLHNAAPFRYLLMRLFDEAPRHCLGGGRRVDCRLECGVRSFSSRREHGGMLAVQVHRLTMLRNASIVDCIATRPWSLILAWTGVLMGSANRRLVVGLNKTE